MIQKIIEYVNSKVKELNSFAIINGLCEYITIAKPDGEVMKFPALYKTGDQLVQVTNYDFRSGVVLHVRNGDTTIDSLESPRANKEFLQYVTPLRLVAIAKRSVTGADNNYSHEQLANNLLHKVENKTINSLKSVLSLSKIDAVVTAVSTDSENIDRIFENIEIKFRHDLSIVLIDYEIRCHGYKECFNNYTC